MQTAVVDDGEPSTTSTPLPSITIGKGVRGKGKGKGKDKARKRHEPISDEDSDHHHQGPSTPTFLRVKSAFFEKLRGFGVADEFLENET